MSKRRKLQRQRLNKRIKDRGNHSKVSRYCSCCANNRGMNSDHYLCPVCLKFTAAFGGCCGTYPISITCKARVPKRRANKSQWEKFIKMFALGKVRAHLERCAKTGEEPNPGWEYFYLKWGGMPIESPGPRGTPKPLRLPWSRRDAQAALDYIDGTEKVVLSFAYGLDGKPNLDDRSLIAEKAGIASNQFDPHLKSASEKMELLVPVMTAFRTKAGKALVKRLARLAAEDTELFQKILDEDETRIAGRIVPKDLVPLLRAEEPEVRLAGVELAGIQRRSR